MAQAAGFDRVIGFDMGGTSTDVFLADADSGGPALTSESIVAGVPVSVPMLDIHTAGAGGGSLARFDAGGLLRVGPESAGSVPGPICFGRGTQPTVTDANLLLGRLDTTQFMSGAVTLDLARTRTLFDQHRNELPSVETFAEGILRVVETQMERAIRVISVERGHDPRRFTLVAFGGGGPLHACAVARALRVPTVLIPAHPGALSAVGILLADSVRDYSRTVMLPGTELPNLDLLFGELEAQAAETNPTAVFERSLDLRYRGQGYELNIPFNREENDPATRFHTLHAQRYGFSNPARPLEIVNLRLRVRIPSDPYAPTPSPTRPGDGAQALRGTQQTFFDGHWHTTPIYDRDKLNPGDTLQGPALIAEYTSATVLPPGAQLTVDSLHNLIITVGAT
jgi:N-methylhydantoinase A